MPDDSATAAVTEQRDRPRTRADHCQCRRRRWRDLDLREGHPALEHAGFVRRSRYADDKRSFVIEPTAASRALRSQVEEVWKELEDAAVGGVSEDERGTILRVLEELEKRLTQTAAELWF
jgi:hypothetical protein